MVEKIIAYRTSDGTIFDCHIKAFKWERCLIDIRELISKTPFPDEYGDAIEEFIADNGDKLYEILRRKFG